MRLSLSSNPDVTFEVVERYAAGQAAAEGRRDQPADALHAQRRRGGALVLRHGGHRPGGHAHAVRPPNNKVSTADYAIGLHASSLVVDGGTLQIGIGSLGDAIGQALIVRDRHGDEYRRILQSLCPGRPAGPRAWAGRFDRACTAARRCSSTASCA
jgi:hypothetical protein